MTDTSRSIFLHGLWRCGSTYVWSRFRAAEETYCFLEPLHHALSRLTRDRIQRDTPDRAAANHHPKLDLPYFHEFGPLVKRRGVRNHAPWLAFDRYLLRPAEADKALFKYVETLTSFAQQQKKTPVLGFNRTAFRMGWMKSHFPSWNLYPRDGALELALYGVEDEVLSIFPVNTFEDYFSRDIVAQKLAEISAEKRNIILSALDKS